MAVHILVVEDEARLREDVAKVLEKAGYVVHSAANAAEALAVLGRIPRPCMLLWDAMTPGQSLAMLDPTALAGVHVATLPVTVAPVPTGGSLRTATKWLTSEKTILSIVREHCPLTGTATG